MAIKCAVCDKAIEYVFLEKIDGTYLKDAKKKKRAVCSACQKSQPLGELRRRL